MANTYTGNSIVDYLKSQGKDSSFSARKSLAESMGITGYTGSGTQNTKLLGMLKSGATSSTTEAPQTNVPSAPAQAEAPATGVVTNEEKKSNNLLGVSDELYDKMNEEFNPSQEVSDRDKQAQNAYANLGALTSKQNIISGDVKSAINSSFQVPTAVTEADAYLSSALQKIQSGKTSYSDQVQAMMDKIMNREKFSYDVDTDPLFQQALASAMNSGKQAMQDTIGQASALTGGYGSTYATSAGNQAYNAFIEDAYDNLPQYYNMAMEAYQMEGEEMYRQFGVLSDLDDKEYNRTVAAYDATYQHRNQLYNEAYGQHRDTKSDAFAMANLQLNEHGQRVNDAYNLYSAASDYADKQYEREYTSWADTIDLAWRQGEMQNNNAWKQKEFDSQESWNQKTFDYQKERDAVADSQWEKQYALEEKLTNAQISKMNSSGGGGGGGRSGGGGGGGDITGIDQKTVDSAFNFKATLLTRDEFNRRGKTTRINGKTARFDDYTQYAETMIDNALKDRKITENEAAVLYQLEW